jgi:Zn-dependent peptidase ImmA (M78 family)
MENVATAANNVDEISLLNKLVSGAVELEKVLKAELVYDYPPAIRIQSSGYVQQAEDAAIWLRNRIGVGLGRIDDLLSVFELELGIRVFCRPLDDPKISGLYAFDPAVGACILVNSNHHWRRRMQTLAHEAGHFISDRSNVDVLDGEGWGLSVSERFARRFGAALLMPAPAVRSRFDQLSDQDEVNVRGLILLAHQFGVATEAMCRRLEDLGLLAEGAWLSIRDRGFSATLEKSVLGDPIPEHSPSMISPRLSYLAAEALEGAVLSEGQLCELLVVDRVELRQAIAPFQRVD